MRILIRIIIEDYSSRFNEDFRVKEQRGMAKPSLFVL